MEIRKATEKDVERLMAIFERAREFMRRTGNMTQWIDGYPSLERVRRDIEEGNCYGVENGEGRVVGTFVAAEGEEPNYREIRDGEWLNDRPYVTIHRLASDGTERGGGRRMPALVHGPVGQCPGGHAQGQQGAVAPFAGPRLPALRDCPGGERDGADSVSVGAERKCSGRLIIFA